MPANPQCFFAARGDCEGRLDRAHLIPKQRMRIRNMDKDILWDPRCWVPMCRKHHTAFDHHFINLRRKDLPIGVEQFAAEHKLEWSLTRDYGGLEDNGKA